MKQASFVLPFKTTTLTTTANSKIVIENENENENKIRKNENQNRNNNKIENKKENVERKPIKIVENIYILP
jgi:hypothetical protein